MPVDPKKLSAFAGGNTAEKKKKKPPAPTSHEEEDEEDLDEDLEKEEEEPEPGMEDEIAEGNVPSGPTNPGAVIPFFEQYADEIEACCDELDYDVLIDPELDMSEEDEVIMQEGAAMLPPRLAGNLWHLTDIDYDAALAIGKHLEEERMSQDAERTAGWIYRIGQLLAADSDEEIPAEDFGEEAEDADFSGEEDDADMVGA